MLAFLRALVATAGVLPWLFAFAGARPPSVNALFASVCHQLPERTLLVCSEPMMVCSRCAGIYAGVALGALLPVPRLLLPGARGILFAALALLAFDVLAQAIALYPILHPTRLATGAFAGWAGSGYMFAVLQQGRPRPALSGAP